MDKLAIELLKKNPRLEIVFLGSKSPKSTLAKWKLAGVFDTSFQRLKDSNIEFQREYKFHYLVDKEDFNFVSSTLLKQGDVFLYDFAIFPSFIYNLTEIYDYKKNFCLDRVFKILHHPTLFIDTDDEKVAFRSVGSFYNFTKEDIKKAFDLANNIYFKDSYRNESNNYYKI